VTGGAGFVGSNLALMLKRDRPGDEVLALDNLSRRGSELALLRLGEGGVTFVHGDVRNAEDLDRVGDVEVLLDCSAEPSVHAGYDGAPRYLINTNLSGTINCLEFARQQKASLIFLSTSRVYPITALRALPLERHRDRFVIPEDRSGPGWSAAGIGTDFPIDGGRTLYGATKLCAELLIQEYRSTYGLSAVINRCGVVAGPWQMGKVDQGFVALWAARHRWGGELAYHGFCANGLQVRDVLHVADLYDLVALEIDEIEAHAGSVYGVGGGPERSVSLRELTSMCARLTGNAIQLGARAETHPSDIPYFVTDNREVSAKTGWKPRRSVENILEDVLSWLDEHGGQLRSILS
jgi:CDP-paratose 2-epimerase